MSIESRSRQYGKVFDHWQIREFLGSGSGGKTAVFRLARSDSDRGASALKVVNLIEERGSLEKLSARRRAEYEAVRDECSASAEQEVWMMDDLRGNTNIVDYLDHTFVDWADDTGFGRDLLIRMELLTDLRGELQRGRQFTEAEVLKVGRDICTALVLCHRKNILHRDVKPENIFLNKDGNYKLGDFGVSRVLDNCPGAMASTGIGTYEYWPAEQMTGRYDTRVDTYSLGLVLYELSNGNRLPFAASAYTTSKEVSRRLSGAELPVPCDASPALAEVILKACAFSPEDRFASAADMLRALRRVSMARSNVTVPQTSARTEKNEVKQEPLIPAKHKKGRHSNLVWGIILLLVGLVAAGVVAVMGLPGSEPVPGVLPGETTEPLAVMTNAETIPLHTQESSVPETTAAAVTEPVSLQPTELDTVPTEIVPETTVLPEMEPLEPFLTEQTEENTEEPLTGIVNSLNTVVTIRSGPDNGDAVLGEYKIGTYITIQETTDANGVSWGHTEDGWIPMDSVYLLPLRAEGEQKPIIGRVNSRSTHVNIRQKATSNSEWMGEYATGTILEIWETAHVNGIQWGRTESGWVCMTYVNMIPEQVEGSPSPLYTGWIILTTELNVRQKPSMQAEIVERFSRGTCVNIYETRVADEKRWGRCDDGWIDLSHVDMLPVDLKYNDVRIIKTDNAPVYSKSNLTAMVASCKKLEVLLIYEYFYDDDTTLCRTDKGWIPEECFY